MHAFVCSQLSHKIFDSFEGCCPLVVPPQTELKLSYLVKLGWINCTHAIKIMIKCSCTTKLFCYVLFVSHSFLFSKACVRIKRNKLWVI